MILVVVLGIFLAVVRERFFAIVDWGNMRCGRDFHGRFDRRWW